VEDFLAFDFVFCFLLEGADEEGVADSLLLLVFDPLEEDLVVRLAFPPSSLSVVGWFLWGLLFFFFCVGSGAGAGAGASASMTTTWSFGMVAFFFAMAALSTPRMGIFKLPRRKLILQGLSLLSLTRYVIFVGLSRGGEKR
jgi:hypothetical protein